jgi:hypothetical protein
MADDSGDYVVTLFFIAVCAFGYFAYRGVKAVWFTPAPAVVSAAPEVQVPVTPPPTPCSVDHRFERTEVYPISLRADIALDSCTGQICRTWSWHALQKNSVWATYEDAPLCSELPNTR